MHYRTVFISDIHLCAYGCRSEECYNFLSSNTFYTLFLVGDILDLWKLRRSIYFPPSHFKLLRYILELAAKGVKINYIVGNHDEYLREFIPFCFNNIFVMDEMEYTLANGNRLLVIHGDQYDAIMINAKWLMKLGDIGYDILMRSNNLVHWVRSLFGYEYWSLSAYLKRKTKSAVNFISKYEQVVSDVVRTKKVDGVVCGHIHHAELKEIEGFTYINCGDWVESCTAIAEDASGNLSLISYYTQVGRRITNQLP
jgi:UDP-2,3-diacylglucosamine pyrophosphatase LpxH